jgi:peptidoglycan/xylan/chitin deacetylase (PgdA/CDA1 family)
MRGVGRIRRAYHTLRRRFRTAGVILVYHRVADLTCDPYQLAVSPSLFVQQLDYLADSCLPMRLLDLVENIERDSLPPRAVAVTFDDGYYDNFQHAFPLLQAANIPATIFVTTGMVGSEAEFWWDDLERVLLGDSELPASLRLTAQARVYEWRLDPAHPRCTAHQDIVDLVRGLVPKERDHVLRQLADWAGTGTTGRPGYRAVTAQELTKLAQSTLIDIGAHTITHARLSMLPPDEQYAEIAGSREALRSLIGALPGTFAYPYGQPDDFAAETVEIVRSAGFRAAATTIPGSIEPGDDPLQLRRCPIFNWDMATFQEQIEAYFVIRG